MREQPPGVDFLTRLERMVTAQSMLGVLRRCHSPLRRLTSFDDFQQDVLLHALRHRRSFKGSSDGELASWIRSIGNQIMVQCLRKSQAAKETPLVVDPADPSSKQKTEQLKWLLDRLRCLSAEDQELVMRRYYERQSWNEIGVALGVSPNTLAQRHLRLLQQLRDGSGDFS